VDEDGSIEQVVGRYRPAGPPAALRARVLAASNRRQTSFAWVPALVAALLIVMIQTAASGVRARVDAVMGVAPEGHRHLVDDLTQRLGGDSYARMRAEALVSADEEHARE
jgi:hypothetical protein